MRLLARWPFGGVLLATVVGCGGAEFVAAPGSDDGGVEADGSSADATVSGEGGTGPDGGAGADGGAKDGAVGADASDASTTPVDGGDAGTNPADGGDGGPAVFACPSADPTVVFCSDFDTATTPPWEWQSAPVTSKGTLAVDTTDFLTPPNGFEASNSALIATDTDTLAYLAYDFSTLGLRTDYVFHLFVKKYDALNNPAIPVAQLTVGPSTSAALTLQVVVKGGDLALAQLFTGTDGGQQTSSLTLGPVATGVWTTVEMLLDRRATNWLVTMTIDGVPKATAQTPITPSNQNLEVDLGILGVLPLSTANELTFDNVTVRAY